MSRIIAGGYLEAGERKAMVGDKVQLLKRTVTEFSDISRIILLALILLGHRVSMSTIWEPHNFVPWFKNEESPYEIRPP